MSNSELIDALERECFDLTAKVIELIEHIGWDVDGTYEFADGDRWYRFNPEEELDDE